METLVTEGLNLLTTVAVSLIAPALAAALVQAFRLLNVQLSEAQQAKVRDIVTQAIFEVEEWASARIKAQLPVSSGQKLTRAVEQIVDKVPGISPEEAEVLVRQELPKVGLGAVHFLAKAAKAAATP